MQQHPAANFNPYAPPTADIDRGSQLGHDGHYVLAERGTRLGAAIVDSLLAGAAALPAGAVLGFLVYNRRSSLDGGDTELMVIGVVAVMSIMVLSFLAYQWYLIATTGQSLAKGWMGLQIVRIDGTPAGFVHGVVLRSWVLGLLSNIPYIGGVLGLVNALMIFGEERRCMHDYIAGTRVIVAPRA